MNSLWIGVLMSLVAYTSGSPKIKRMIGGETALPGLFPYHVSIQFNGKHICGGSIIGVSTILTAASCIPRTGTLRVLAGALDLNNLKEKDIQYRDVIQIIFHPKYDATNYNFDLAILKVNEGFKLNGDVDKVKLGLNEVKKEDALIMTGYAPTEEDKPPQRLQLLTMLMVTPFDCGNAFLKSSEKPELFPGKMCAITASRKGAGPCFGDYGSPIINQNTELVGVFSWNLNCDATKPSVFSATRFYDDWIQLYL